MINARILLLLTIPIFGAACQATHLLYVHQTTLGVDVDFSPDETSGQIIIGYDRDTFALIPEKKSYKSNDNKVAQSTSSNETSGDVMNLASVSCVDIEGLNKFQFNQFIATGKTAEIIAKDDEALPQLRKALYGTGDKKCKE